MRYPSMLALFAVVTAVALSVAAQDEKSNADQKALQGMWTAKKGDKIVKLTFASEKFTLEIGEKKMKGDFALDSSKSPKHLDVTVTEATDDNKQHEGKTAKGIFELNGDRLRWFSAAPGRDLRPAALPEEGKREAGLYLSLEREKK
jgi:uncharacterized protein (TIGR03067 family)